MRNRVLNFALLFETFIAAAVVYIPPLNIGEASRLNTAVSSLAPVLLYWF